MLQLDQGNSLLTESTQGICDQAGFYLPEIFFKTKPPTLHSVPKCDLFFQWMPKLFTPLSVLQ